MANLTIRNLPDDLVQRIKTVAATKGHSMEQEIRESLEIRYATRLNVISRIRQRWQALPTNTPDEVEQWRTVGRK
jgi:hypothetical protein